MQCSCMTWCASGHCGFDGRHVDRWLSVHEAMLAMHRLAATSVHIWSKPQLVYVGHCGILL